MEGVVGGAKADPDIHGAGERASPRARRVPMPLPHYTPASPWPPSWAATGAQEGNPPTEEEVIASAIVTQGVAAARKAARALERIPQLASAARYVTGLSGAVFLQRAAQGLWNGVIREVHHACMRNSAEMPSSVEASEAAEAEAAIEPLTLRYRDPELEHIYLATKWRFHMSALRFITLVSLFIGIVYFTTQLHTFGPMDLSVHVTVQALHLVAIVGVFTYPRESQWEPWFDYVIAVGSLILALDAFAYALRRPHHDVRNAVYMLIPPFLTPTLFGMPFRTNFLTYMVQCVALLGCGTALLPPFEIVMCFLVAEATAYFLERNHKISFYLVDLRGRKERSTRVKLLLAQLAHSRVQRDVELRNQYLSFLCHEVRNPANGILGNAQLLQDTSLSAEQRDLMNDLIASVEQMGNVLNNVLDLNKLEAGKLELDMLPCKLSRVASTVSSQFRRPALDRGIALRVEVDEALAASALDYPFYTDTYRLLQCCSNLMSNACKFTQAGSVTLRVVLTDVVLGDEGGAGCGAGAGAGASGLRKRYSGEGGAGGGVRPDPASEGNGSSACVEEGGDMASRLSAAVERIGGRSSAPGQEGDDGMSAQERASARNAFVPYCVARFEVRDTGPGLSKADQRKLFISYSQCHASVARAHGGTGLGLTIVKELSQLMGGRVGVASRVGRGSAFFFTTRLYLRKPSAQVLEALQNRAKDAAQEEVHRVESLHSTSRVDDVIERVRDGTLKLGDEATSFADAVEGRAPPPRTPASPHRHEAEDRRGGSGRRSRAPSSSAAPARCGSTSSNASVSSSDEKSTVTSRSGTPSYDGGAREPQPLPEALLPCPRRVVEVYSSHQAQGPHRQRTPSTGAYSSPDQSPLRVASSGDSAHPHAPPGDADGQGWGVASLGAAEPRLLSFSRVGSGNVTPSSFGDGVAGVPAWSGDDRLSSSSSSNTSFYTVGRSLSGDKDAASRGGSPVVKLTARSRSEQRANETTTPTMVPDPDSSDEIVLTSTHGARSTPRSGVSALLRGRRHTTSSATSRAMDQAPLFSALSGGAPSPRGAGVIPFGARDGGGEDVEEGGDLSLSRWASSPSTSPLSAAMPLLPAGMAVPRPASSDVPTLPALPVACSQRAVGAVPLPPMPRGPTPPLAPPLDPATGPAPRQTAVHRLCQWRRPPQGSWVREPGPQERPGSDHALCTLPGLSVSVLVVGVEAGEAVQALLLGHEHGSSSANGPPPPSGLPLHQVVAAAMGAVHSAGEAPPFLSTTAAAAAEAAGSHHARVCAVGALLGAARCSLSRVDAVEVPWLDGPGATQVALRDCGAGEGWTGGFANRALRQSEAVLVLAAVPEAAGRPLGAALHASQRLAMTLVRACAESSRRASLPLPPLVVGVLAPAEASVPLVTGSGWELNPLWDPKTMEASAADAGAAALIRSVASEQGAVEGMAGDLGLVLDRLVSTWCNALCVDDSLINARLLHRHATSCFGVSPTVVSNGEEAIAAARSKLEAHGPYRLVFMDIDLGSGINGREAAARIRQLPPPESLTARHAATRMPRFSAQPIIVAVTGNATKQEQEACRAEMDDFLAKPVPVNRFRDFLRAAFRDREDFSA